MIGKHKHLEHLQALLEFTDDDLEANREGFLGPTQRTKINQWDYWGKIGISVIVAVVLLLFSVWQVIWWTKALVILAAVIGIWAGQHEILRFWDMYSSYMRDPTVDAVEGVIELDIGGSSGESPTFKIKIGGREFKVSKEVFLGFKNHEPYRLYFIPKVDQLVSAEHLHDDYFDPDASRLYDEQDEEQAWQAEETARPHRRRNRQ